MLARHPAYVQLHHRHRWQRPSRLYQVKFTWITIWYTVMVDFSLDSPVCFSTFGWKGTKVIPEARALPLAPDRVRFDWFNQCSDRESTTLAHLVLVQRTSVSHLSVSDRCILYLSGSYLRAHRRWIRSAARRFHQHPWQINTNKIRERRKRGCSHQIDDHLCFSRTYCWRQAKLYQRHRQLRIR